MSVDGITIGRAAIGYPSIFNEIKHFLKTGENLSPPFIEEHIKVIKQHLHYSVKWKGLKAGINEMRRHYANYLKGLPNIKEFRLRLVTINELAEIDALLDQIAIYYKGIEFSQDTISIKMKQIVYIAVPDKINSLNDECFQKSDYRNDRPGPFQNKKRPVMN